MDVLIILYRFFIRQVLLLEVKNGVHCFHGRVGEPIKVKPKKLPVSKCGKDLKEKVDTPK